MTEQHTQQSVDTFTREVALLFFRMRQAATEYLGQGRHSSGRRSILKSLGDLGPHTVPQMARARGVSRQHIQRIVDELRRDGLVDRAPNPAHRRSLLIELTAEGEGMLVDMERRESELFRYVAAGLGLEQIDDATEVVRHVRHRLESSEWQELVGKR